MYETKQFVNSSETTISLSLPYDDWCLLKESVLWKHLDKYLEACQSADTQQTPQERAKILEMEVRGLKRKTEKELLHQQLELLTEKSKDTYPASNELSQNSFAMVRISNELLKRKCFAVMFAFAFGYFIKCLTKHRK